MKMKLIASAGLLSLLVAVGCSQHYGRGLHARGDIDTRTDRGVRHMGPIIDKTVHDPQRAAQVKTLVAEIGDEMKQAYRNGRLLHRRLHDLNANYLATPDEMSALVDEMSRNLTQSAKRIVDARFKIKAQLTAEEWNSLSDRLSGFGNRHWYD